MSDKNLKSLLGRNPSLAPTVERLARIPRPVAGPPRPAEEELLLIPPDPSEGRAPRRPSNNTTQWDKQVHSK